MLAVKRIVTIAVMVYLLLALLFVLAPGARNSVMDMGSGLSALEKERQFYYVMFIIGAVVMGLQLITENLDSVLLRRSVTQHEGKINELKAKLYDHQQRSATPLSVPGGRTVDGRVADTPVIPGHPAYVPEPRPAAPDALPQPTFPQNDPSLSNTPPADRPPLA